MAPRSLQYSLVYIPAVGVAGAPADTQMAPQAQQTASAGIPPKSPILDSCWLPEAPRTPRFS